MNHVQGGMSGQHHAPRPIGHATDAQVEALTESVERLSAQVTYLVERQRKTEELFEEFTPVLKEMMNTATERLAVWDEKGYFDFGRELGRVGERVVEGFSPEDVRKFGDAIVGILSAVRTMTQPEVLAILQEASTALGHADDVKPVGMLGAMKATRDEEVQKGMAVLIEMMRHVGRAATAVRAASPAEQKKARLKALTQSRKAPALPAAESAPKAAPQPKPRAAAKAAACAVPATGPQPVASTFEGVGLSQDGHLADPSTWTPELGHKMAFAMGVELTEARWQIIQFARADFLATNASPNIRRITQSTGVSTKDLYQLFPKAPGRTIAKIAGIPKPAGCI
ncbi:MAG: TusE/DsrC/DsvC family sulfur relay protein [Polyangiaceae bacterium]